MKNPGNRGTATRTSQPQRRCAAILGPRRPRRGNIFFLVLGISLAGCAGPANSEAQLPQNGIVGSWVGIGDLEGGIMSFLGDGEYQSYAAGAEGSVQPPPVLLDRGRWEVSGDRLVLTEIRSSVPGVANVDRIEARFSIDGDFLTLTYPDAGVTDQAMRTDWLPDPIPADAAMVPFFDTLTGRFALELEPAVTEGRPGNVVTVRITLTNRDDHAYPVPIRLRDRVFFTSSLLREIRPGEFVDLLVVDPPAEADPVLSTSLAPGASRETDVVWVVPDRAGRYRLKAMVLGGAGTTAQADFEVLPAE